MKKRILAILLAFALVISNVPMVAMATEVDIVPTEPISQETVPVESVPEETVPEETVPEETVPEETTPEMPAPGSAAPAGAATESTDGNVAPEADANSQAALPDSMALITEGEWDGYYPITTVYELNAIRNKLDGKYVLMNDLVFSSADFERGGAFYNGGAGWSPIGTYNDRFTGTFDGNGHTISNLFVNFSSDKTVYAGLFGYAEGTLCNVGIINCDVTGKALENEGYANTGALAGSIQNCNVSNCYSTGTVYGTRTTGGLLGYVSPNCTITDCYNACTVTGRGYIRGYTGGLLGYINDNITVENCYNEGTVDAKISKPADENAYCAIGGVTSYIQDSSQVINCYNTADILVECQTSSAGNYTVGGIAGSASGKIKDCYNTGNLETDVGYLGGIVGRLYAEVTGCYNMGEVDNTCLLAYHNAGGIAGLCGDNSFIGHCYNTGKVSSLCRSGGIVGYAYQEVSNCYNIGDVSALAMLNLDATAGGIMGYSNGAPITKCWNYGDITSQPCLSSAYRYAYAGGLCGTGDPSTISNSFNAGKCIVFGGGNYYIGLYSGGIIGDFNGSGTMKNCYNVGTASTLYTGSRYISENKAGLAAGADDSVSFTNCYYLNTNSVGVDLGDDAGTKCSPTQMLMQSTYSGFDFGSTWTMAGHSDYDYPELQSNPVKEHVQSISFASKPSKTSYLQFVEELDVTGGVLKLTYNTGTTEEIAITRDMVSGFDNTYDGELSLKVTYEGFSVYYTVKIVAMKSISLASEPAKKDYLQYWDELDMTGAALTVTYKNGATRDAALTADMVSGYDNTVAGTQTLTVTLGWLTTTFQVNIVPISKIAVTTLPIKTSYLKDAHELDVTGGEITVTYQNGKTVKVEMAQEMVSGFDNTVPGRQTLTVLYYDHTTTFDVFILCLDSIAVTTLPNKTVYLEAKETLDVTGGKLTLYYNDGSTEQVDLTLDMISGFDNTVPGQQTLTVSYNGKTATFQITIQEKALTSMELTQLPYKLKFLVDKGELDVSGGELSLGYDNGTRETIEMTTDMVTGFDNSQLGTITLTVNYRGFTATYDVQICLGRTIALNCETLHLFTGKTKTLKAKLTVHEPSLSPSKTTLVWSTGDKSVATVTSKGTITAKGVGETVITCYAKDDPDVNATVVLTVTKAVTAIKLDKTTATISIGAGEDLGKTLQLNIKSITPSTATDQTVTWTSSNEAVATVDQNGLVTSVGEGSATIKATANDGSGKFASCKVTVKLVKLTALKLPKTATITIGSGEDLGKTMTLTPTYSPSSPYKSNLVWTSSKPAVATVDANGVVTSVGEGTATITCKDTVSGKSATCKVTVKLVKVSSVKLPKSATISIGAGEDLGKTLTLKATVSPAAPHNSTLTWTSSKESVATVDENGVVTSVAPGTTTITAKANDGSGKSAKCTVKVSYVSVTKLTVSATKLKLATGESAALLAKISPSNAYTKTLTWTSSNPSVVAIEADDNVVTLKALATGSATITCRYGSKSVTTKVTVVSTRSGSPTTAEKNALAMAVAKEIADQCTGETDLERVYKASQIVAYYCYYAEYTNDDPDYRSPYGVFVKGVYTCAGSTRALGMVLELMGFQWKHVNENQWTHQWCSLTMDGQKGYADGMAGIAGYGTHPSA